MSNIDIYEQTLSDLKLRRARCLEDLKTIEAAIAGLRAAMDITIIKPSGSVVASVAKVPMTAEDDPKQEFTKMSVRWGILKLLSQSLDPLRSSEISDALVAGGNPKASRSTVSAIMSDMVNKRGEAELHPETGGYLLTANGEAAWKAIEHSERYINRAAYASEQQQPA